MSTEDIILKAHHSAGLSPMDRLWRAVEAEPRRALEDGLSPTDLQSLLLAVARARAGRVNPARVFRRWGEDRFVRPSVHDPRMLSRVESRLWAMLPDGFAGVELSPVAPLGRARRWRQ